MKLTHDYVSAQDLFQETALRAFSHKEKFRDGTNFKNWISVIMRNTFINQYRRNKNRKTVSDPIEQYYHLIEGRFLQYNRGESNLRWEELEQTLDQVREIYRTPFLLYFVGFEYQEIADQLGIPVGTVKSRIHQARKHLKSLLSDVRFLN